MFRKVRLLLLLIMIFIITTACSDSESSSEVIQEEEAVEESEPVIEVPETEEIQQTVEKTITEIHKVMRKETEDPKWFALNAEEKEETIQTELEETAKPLSEFISEESVKDYAAYLLEVFTCECDSYSLFRPTDTRVGFTVLDYTDEAFKAESITLGDGALYTDGWKNTWSFQKEDDRWKLSDHEMSDTASEPLDLTFEDIEHSFRDYETDEPLEVEFVEYTNEADGRYMVIKKQDENYEAYHTETGSMNMELSLSYREAQPE